MILTKPRPGVENAVPYLPGKPIGEVQRELGLKSVIKLASNENPLGPSPRALAALKRWSGKCHLYPEGSSPLLRAAVAARHGVAAERVIAGNGSDELIRLVCIGYLAPGDEVVTSRYAFIRFRQSAQLMGARVVEVPMRDWTHDLDAMAAAVTARTKVVFIASPNNPTGTFNTEAELRRFLKAVPRAVLVVLDEAYYDFARAKPGHVDGTLLAREHENLLVLRTFSKVYGLAGLRVGYGVGDPGLVATLDRIRMPFNVNLLAQHAAAAALEDRGFAARSVALVEKERPALRAALHGLGFRGPDTASNFVFVESARPAQEVFEALLRRGVIVRPLGEYGLDRHLRVSLGSPAQNRRLLEALRAVTGGSRG